MTEELIAVLRAHRNELARELEDTRELNVQLMSKIKELEDTLQEQNKDLKFLDALFSAGVDNWDGYDYALEIRESL